MSLPEGTVLQARIILLLRIWRYCARFEEIRKPRLETAGISPRIIQHLHDIYKLRASISLADIHTAISDMKFLKKKPDRRVTRGDLEDDPDWKILKIRPINTNYFSRNSFDKNLSKKTN